MHYGVVDEHNDLTHYVDVPLPRYTYAATGKPGWFLFDGLVKHDVCSGSEERYRFGDRVYGSETAMAPRLGATGEDDGYLVTLTTDMNADASYCLIFDATRLADGPLCRLQLPERIPVAPTRRGFPASSYAAGMASPDKSATRAHTEHPNAAIAPPAPT